MYLLIYQSKNDVMVITEGENEKLRNYGILKGIKDLAVIKIN